MIKKDNVIALLATVVLSISAFSISAFAGPGPAGEKVDTGYDEETWTRLQDHVLEYDEIPDLVHEYNTVVSDVWEDLEETRQDLIENAELLESQKRMMKERKEDAMDEMERLLTENPQIAQDPNHAKLQSIRGEIENYAMHEIVLDILGSGINSSARSSLVTRTTLGSLEKMENQFIQIAQQLMIAYDSLNKQKATLTKLEELYGEQYRIMSNMYELGMTTQKNVLAAQADQMSAKSTIAALEGGLLQLKPTLCTMTGWPADGNPELAPIPPVDLSRLEQMDLETDTRKAIGNNTTLIAQRTSEKGKTNAGVDARLGVIHEGDARMTIEMERLYNDVFSKKTAYDAASDGYQSGLLDKRKYDQLYELGMMSKAEYLGTEIAFYQKKAAWEIADTSLLLALETYQWAVLGLAEVPE